MTDREIILQNFAKQNNIALERVEKRKLEVIYRVKKAIQALDIAIYKDRERLLNQQPDSMWGILLEMLTRIHEYAHGALILYALGQPACAEINARTITEASVNLSYILNSNIVQRLQSYLFEYVKVEREQNNKWRKAVRRTDKSQWEIQYSAIDQKNIALQKYEDMIKRTFDEINIPHSKLRWPNIFERFKEIGREIDYRTKYAAMCSQTHNDAEDLLNRFFVRALSGKKGMLDLTKEEERFSEMLGCVDISAQPNKRTCEA
jgi:hypothetical protein